MNNEAFEKIVNRQLDVCKNILNHKGTEYGGIDATEDRLLFFKCAALLQGISTKEALAGMMIKHTISIYDMCKDSDHSPIEKWNEKITDHINYLLLLKAIVSEENNIPEE